MGELVDIAFSFPAVVFTISTVILVGFWAATMLIGGGLDALDGVDLGFDTDVDLDVDAVAKAELELTGGAESDVASPESAGLLQTILQFLGIIGMPLLLALNLLSLFAWAITMIAVTVLGPSNVNPLIGLGVGAGAFLGSGFITGRVASRYGAAMAPAKALRRGELVGRFCTITTQRVTTDFGQAEVRDAEGGSLIVQVRAAEDNQLGRGDKALIVDVDNDAGIYQLAVGLEELAD